MIAQSVICIFPSEEEITVLCCCRSAFAGMSNQLPAATMQRNQIHELTIRIFRPNGRRRIDQRHLPMAGQVLADAATVYGQHHPATFNERCNHFVNLFLVDRVTYFAYSDV